MCQVPRGTARDLFYLSQNLIPSSGWRRIKVSHLSLLFASIADIPFLRPVSESFDFNDFLEDKAFGAESATEAISAVEQDKSQQGLWLLAP